MRRLVVVLLSMGLVAGVPAMSASAAGATARTVVFAPTSHPDGVSYATWSTRWSQWAFGTPVGRNPLANPANCNVAQHVPAFFLPAPSGPGMAATCVVPAGEALLLAPAGNLATPDHGSGRIPRLLASAKADTDRLTGIAATLDGSPLPVSAYRTASPFVLVLPRNNLLGVAGGPTLAAIDGYFLMLRPLAVGSHTVTTTDTFPDGSTASIVITVQVVRSHRG